MRGAFRDSRTARSGKTNAELMAYAINELARMVHKHSPNTTAVFWADMINPYRAFTRGHWTALALDMRHDHRLSFDCLLRR